MAQPKPKHEYVTRSSELHRRQSLELVVLRACQNCGAPAFFSSDPSILDGWPGAYVKPGHPLNGKPVGEVCPNCKHVRTIKPEPHGEVWSREWRSGSEPKILTVLRRAWKFIQEIM